MGELADAGAAGFTDDGRPVVAAGLMRRALQYGADHRPPARAALRGADALARRPDARGRGLRRARLRRLPVGRRERRWSSATSRSPPTRAGRCTCMHLSARESVEARRAAPRPRASRRPREVTPHHLCLTDEAVRSLDSNVKMNPPLRAEDDRAGADRGAPRRDDRLRRHRPRAARAAREGGAVRGGAVRRHRARDGVRGALHATSSSRASLPLATLLERMSAGPARVYGLERAADRGRRAGEPRPARPRARAGASSEDGFRSRSANSWLLGRDARGQGAADRRRRAAGRSTA